MFPLLSAAVSGGASLLGGLFSSQTSAANTQAQIASQQAMQKETEDFNAGQAQISRDYNTQMSNTAYTRASADMKNAGLNPAMMFGGGSAASTPASPTASVSTPSVPMPQNKSPLSGLGDAVTNALDSAIKTKQIDLLSSEVAQKNVQTDVMARQAPLTRSKTAADIGNTVSQTRRTTALQPEAEAAGVMAGDLLSADPTWRRNAVVGGFYGDKFGKVIQPISSLVSSATAAGRIANAFSDLKSKSLDRKIDQGNFVGKYGTPVDEYISN
jgi:hypothetical protein